MELFKKKTVLEELQAEISAYNDALSSAQGALDAALVREANAKEEMESAAELNDTAAFSSAKQKLAEAETALEMAQMRKDRIIKKGAVSKSDADSAEAWYKKKLHELNKEAAKQIVEHIDEICRIAAKAKEDSQEISKDYSSALRLLGREIPLEIRNGHYSELDSILREWMSITGPVGAFTGNGAKTRLYKLAERNV